MELKDIRSQTGFLWPAGIPIGQSWHDLLGLFGLIQFNQVDLFVEIGFRHGGLAALVANYMYHADGQYLGFELERKFVDEALRKRLNTSRHGHLVVGNIFSEWCVDKVREAILKSKKKALIYCDGGNKIKEVHHLAPFLRKGDLLAAHDLGREIRWKDVEDLNGFVPFQAEYLQWADILVLEKQ